MDERGNPYPIMPHQYLEHAHDGHPFWHVLIFILLLLIAAAALVFLYRLLTRRPAGILRPVAATGGSSAAAALEVVRMRYARGEIKRDEFVRMSADFGAPPEPVWPDSPAPAAEAPTVADEPAPPAEPAG